MRGIPVLGLLTVSLLAACGQPMTSAPAAAQPPTAATLGERAQWLADRPELQDADSQAIIRAYGQDPAFVASVERAYTGAPGVNAAPSVARPDLLHPQDLASTRLAFIKSVAWGSVANYNREYANQASTNASIPGLDWSRDGCSAPDGLGLGYREDFRPACNVHDFGYRNLKVYERTDANRKATDEAFHTNMEGICAAKSWYARPACYSAAYAYYQAVRIGGSGSF
ncbi:phospholipase A2 [Deinococcus maricopensis]|uniref:Phospholipase A2 n=1 Tax=Deinococcus maricopensis (strain DSM 21211 / LMG 22137 / NRRL B-23946 / LB-34) TaxID=709986 RepID=E8UB36_DEIML|nr:phospholipase A2 [Deinococcus maricopensis]ADV68275.1 phospholipase A2 [Deinococcus maricopensis DSM 21211]